MVAFCACMRRGIEIRFWVIGEFGMGEVEGEAYRGVVEDLVLLVCPLHDVSRVDTRNS